jgi:hypothetical protein
MADTLENSRDRRDRRSPDPRDRDRDRDRDRGGRDRDRDRDRRRSRSPDHRDRGGDRRDRDRDRRGASPDRGRDNKKYVLLFPHILVFFFLIFFGFMIRDPFFQEKKIFHFLGGWISDHNVVAERSSILTNRFASSASHQDGM